MLLNPKQDLNIVNAKKELGQNKLRTYILFKTEYCKEDYANSNGVSHRDRRALAKIHL